MLPARSSVSNSRIWTARVGWPIRIAAAKPRKFGRRGVRPSLTCLASSQEAPSVVDRKPPPPGGGGGNILKKLSRRVEKKLSNLQLAILELALLAAFSAVGTIIEQNQTLDWYMTNYPDGPRKVLGFLDYSVLLFLQLDHIYTSYYFLGISTLLAASLIACSKTQQLPLVKVARNWKFATKQAAVLKKGNGETLPGASVIDLGRILVGKGYNVFHREGSLYAFKGIAGRFAPIAVHVSLLAIMFGAAFGALAGFEGQVMLPEGNKIVVGQLLRGAATALPGIPLPDGGKSVLSLDKFIIDYRPDGSIGQYRSVLTVSDLDGKPLRQKEIYVNEPLRFGGITIYQTDWGMAALKIRVGADPGKLSEPVLVPVSELSGALGLASSAEVKLYGAFVPLELPPQDGSAPKGVSILARDLQQVVFYDSDGQFSGVRRPGSNKPQQVEGQWFVIDEVLGASGMQLKNDPGTAYVYAGFAALMITTIVSYTSHSQVWALQDGTDVHVGGRTNRALVAFQGELDAALEAVPEHAPPAPPTPSAAADTAAGKEAPEA